MSDEANKLTIDRERLTFEQQKHNEQIALDERKFQSDQSAKKWSQAATFVPIALLILGFFLGQSADRSKKEQDRASAVQVERIRFIKKQLAEFYYPVKMRLDRDNAVWEVSAQNKNSKSNLRLANDIEAKLIMPNHDENMELITSKFHLLSNDAEQVNLGPLIAAMNRYQRHATIYKALRESNDARFPFSVCDDCGYPKEFEEHINLRIASLETQRAMLVRAQH